MGDNAPWPRTVGLMTRAHLANPALAQDLADLRAAGAGALTAGILHALGQGPGPELDPADLPILGYHLTTSEALVTLTAVTPTRFVRYEVVDSTSLTVAVPISRITRVVQQTTAAAVSVTVELDADATTHRLEYREGADPNDPALLAGLTQGRTERASYTLTAATAEDAAAILAFALALTRALN